MISPDSCADWWLDKTAQKSYNRQAIWLKGMLLAKKEAIVEDLNLLRSVILASLAAFFGIYGYVAIHVKNLQQMTIILGIIGAFFLAILMFFCGKLWKKRRDDLER